MRAICAAMHVKLLTVVTCFSCSGCTEYVQKGQNRPTLFVSLQFKNTGGAVLQSRFDSYRVDCPVLSQSSE